MTPKRLVGWCGASLLMGLRFPKSLLQIHSPTVRIRLRRNEQVPLAKRIGVVAVTRFGQLAAGTQPV